MHITACYTCLSQAGVLLIIAGVIQLIMGIAVVVTLIIAVNEVSPQPKRLPRPKPQPRPKVPNPNPNPTTPGWGQLLLRRSVFQVRERARYLLLPSVPPGPHRRNDLRRRRDLHRRLLLLRQCYYLEHLTVRRATVSRAMHIAKCMGCGNSTQAVAGVSYKYNAGRG